VRIALVYDCLYPYTGGGAERWLRALAVELAKEHDVTYVTRRHWAPGAAPRLDGARCVGVSAAGPIYTSGGRRRLMPAARFGLGALLHFARNRGRYDVVHCLSYPYLSLIAIRLALAGAGGGNKVWCEWLECLSDEYWRAYGGRVGGVLGRAIQGLCVRLTPAAFAFSRHTCRRLRQAGFAGPVHLLGGLTDDRGAAVTDADVAAREELVLFAGRHVPDKGIMLLPRALAIARRRRPELRAVIAGDGPLRTRVRAELERLGLSGAAALPGFVSGEELEGLFHRAACLVAPSIRDGYGMAVAEAASAGLPVAVCRSPDNAAAERVQEGVNGAIAARPGPRELADAICRILDQGEALRRRTAAWYASNRQDLAMGPSIERVKGIYSALDGP
jgi:glycosyltransferase involved in cell wall biosynthesis